MTLSIMTLSIMTLSEGIQGNVTQHYDILYYDTLKNIAQHFVMMIAAFFVVMLCTIMLSVTLQSVVMLVTILS
jgi:hypothetical protein